MKFTRRRKWKVIYFIILRRPWLQLGHYAAERGELPEKADASRSGTHQTDRHSSWEWIAHMNSQQGCGRRNFQFYIQRCEITTFGQQQMIPDTFYHQTCDSRHNFVGKTVKTVLVSKCGQKSEGAGNLSLSYCGENELLAGRAIKSGRVIHFLWPAFIWFSNSGSSKKAVDKQANKAARKVLVHHQRPAAKQRKHIHSNLWACAF
jgi:hypothetical protein